MSEAVGFVGLGAMGSGIARNLLRKGYSLWVHDLRPEAVAPLVSEGARSASLEEMGNACETFFLCLPDGSAVQTVLFGQDGLAQALSTGQVVVDTGTTHPSTAQEISLVLGKRGIAFVDAPVSGMKARAEAGTLLVMVGGEEAVFLRLRPLFEAFGGTVVHLGPSGQGQLAKMLNNVLFNISCAAMAEILPTAVRLGLDPGKFVSAVGAGSGQSFGFDFFAPLVLRRDFGPGYPMASAWKDMVTFSELTAPWGASLPVTAATRATYQMALDGGWGGENKGAMIKVWESEIGARVGGGALT